jgi:hypothetical protein
LLLVLSPVNTVGGSPASFPLLVGVAIVTVVILPLLDTCPCPKDIAGAVAVVICGAGGLPCLAMKLWIWLAILLVIVA